VTAALGWGALAASSLVIGALLGLARTWPDRAVGIVLAFGAGALVSAVSFDLAEEGLRIGSGAAVGGGLAVGALTYFGLDRLVERRGSGQGAGPALALGAFLDGIPEQAVLGIGLATGDGVSVSLLAAIFVSNLPEAIGSATEMRAAGTVRRRSGGCGSPSRWCARSPRWRATPSPTRPPATSRPRSTASPPARCWSC
jgi:zinc transporter, ZIP family